jgi:hypothetical protein
MPVNFAARQLVAMAGLLVVTASAHAALRVPQVPVQGSGLQTYLNQYDGYIDVSTAQLDAQHWTNTVSSNNSFAIQIQLAGNASGNEIGLYNGGSAAPSLYRVFPASATDGWFAVASFRFSPVRVVVNLFDATAAFQGATTYLGADRNDYAFYLQGPGGTFYSQDIRNPGHDPRVLAYAGTGINTGSFWMAFEDGPVASPDHDFDDVILYLEGGAYPLTTAPPVAVVRSSWGMVKARFR